MTINTCTLVGTVVDGPQLREVGHTDIAEFKVAIAERVVRDGEWEDYATFVDVAVWGKQGRACADHLRLDSEVAIAGRLAQPAERGDRGPFHGLVRVVAQSVQFLGPAPAV